MVFEFVFSSPAGINIVNIKKFINFLERCAQMQNLKFSYKNELLRHQILHSFFVDCQASDIVAFADYIAHRLPLSIDFCFVELKTDCQVPKKWKKNAKKNINFLDAFEIKEILNKQSPYFCEVFKWIKNIKCLKKSIFTAKDVEDTLSHLAKKLLDSQSLRLKTPCGNWEFFTNKKKNDVMFWDLSNAMTFLRIESVQSQILASYEKPSMRLCPKEIFASTLLQDGYPYEINARLPDDILLSLLGQFCLESKMGYVFVEKCNDLGEWDLSYEYSKQGKLPFLRQVTVSSDGLIVDTNIAKRSKSILDIIETHFDKEETLDKNIFSDTNLQKVSSPSNQQKLIIYLSKIHPTRIWIKDQESYKDLLSLAFEVNPKLILKTIELHYKDGDKLLKNFGENFGNILSNIQLLPDISRESKNIMDILSSAAFVLGYTRTFSPNDGMILNNAKKFVRDKGPRIDFKLKCDKEGHLELETPKVLRSAMSFRLAGLDEATLSYGFVDSMAEFLGNFARDAMLNFGIKTALLCGDMLTEKIFLDKILHYFPKNIGLILPQAGFVDYH